MTKTFIPVLSPCFAYFGLPVMMPLDKTEEEFFVWNFEFGSLGFVWDLVIGAWNFHDFHQAGSFPKISKHPV
ncbi:MAG: hypothetical protein JSW26_00715 [Desulfobacterales bacterium]|nr:MAG: hypothetical protein JSW26_00715 [Desulfobacterales bacterium]